MATKSASTRKPTKKTASKTAAKRPAAKSARAASTPKKPATKKPAAKKAATKATPASAARKATTAKPVAKKTAARKTAAKPATAKARARKTAAPQTAAAKTAAPKPAAKKSATRAKAVARKSATTSKAAPAAKKPAAKKAAPDAAAAKKAPAKTAAKKPAAKAAEQAKTPKPAPQKKLNVGQKPRGGVSEPTIVPTALQKAANEPAPTGDAKIAATPEAKEAKQTYRVNDHIVYPAHGVGRIVTIEKQVIAGITNELFVIDFEQEKMKLRVPTAKAAAVGMRPLSEPATIDKAVELLKGRARIKRTMWSRRAQEYEAKINSGDVMSVAEVVRDLFRAADQPEQSYSERQLFEQALDRFAREVAAVRKSGLDAAIAELEASLHQKKAA